MACVKLDIYFFHRRNLFYPYTTVEINIAMWYPERQLEIRIQKIGLAQLTAKGAAILLADNEWAITRLDKCAG